MADGRAQKANIRAQPGTRIRHSLVGGLFIPQWESRELARVVIRDPEPTDLARLLMAAAEDSLRLVTVQFGVAKHLALAGLWDAANHVATQTLGGLDSPADALRRLLDRSALRVKREMPFRAGKRGERHGTIVFRVDVERLVERLTSGTTLYDALGALAAESVQTEWVHGPSANGKSAELATPYQAKLSVSLEL